MSDSCDSHSDAADVGTPSRASHISSSSSTSSSRVDPYSDPECFTEVGPHQSGAPSNQSSIPAKPLSVFGENAANEEETSLKDKTPATLPIFDRATLSPIISFDSYSTKPKHKDELTDAKSVSVRVKLALDENRNEINATSQEDKIPFDNPDDRIEHAIRSRLCDRLHQAAQLIVFDVDCGHVMMKGSVCSFYFKQLVQEAALRVPGVLSVTNQVRVEAADK